MQLFPMILYTAMEKVFSNADQTRFFRSFLVKPSSNDCTKLFKKQHIYS